MLDNPPLTSDSIDSKKNLEHDLFKLDLYRFLNLDPLKKINLSFLDDFFNVVLFCKDFEDNLSKKMFLKTLSKELPSLLVDHSFLRFYFEEEGITIRESFCRLIITKHSPRPPSKDFLKLLTNYLSFYTYDKSKFDLYLSEPTPLDFSIIKTSSSPNSYDFRIFLKSSPNFKPSSEDYSFILSIVDCLRSNPYN